MGAKYQLSSRALLALVSAFSALLLVGIFIYSGSAPAAFVPFEGKAARAFGIVFKVLAAPLITMWCYSACRRCTDRFVQRCLVGICVLCLFWVLATLVKYPCRIDWLVRLLWYLFYLPIIFIPLLCSYIAIHLARGSHAGGFVVFQAVSFGVSCALLALVLTDGLHHLVFVIDPQDPSWESAYGYGPGYWVVVAWVGALVASCPLALVPVARRDLRRAIALLLVMLAGIGGYALLYALRVPIAFESSVAMVYTVFVIGVFEAVLRLGLVPVQGNQVELFERLPFELEVFDDAGELCYRTDAAAARDGGEGEPSRRREVTPLSTGYAAAVKDTALVDRKARELEQVRAQLERQHDLLRAEYGIDATLRVQQELESLYDEVSESVSQGLRRVAALLEDLPADDPAARTGQRWARVAEARLLLGLCKQKGQCVVDARSRGEFSGDYLKLGMAEACANLRAVGVEAAVLVEAEPLGAQELLALLDELYAWGVGVLGQEASTIVARVALDGGTRRVRLLVECGCAARALARRRELSHALVDSYFDPESETTWVLDETSLSVSAPLLAEGRIR